MSVINSMLRDLDRRHAPLPIKTNVQPTVAQNNRALPRSAVGLCVVIILVVWSWNHRIKYITDANISIPTTNPAVVQPVKVEAEAKPTPIVTQPSESVTPQQNSAASLASPPKSLAALAKIDKPSPQTNASKQTETASKREATVIAAEKPATNSAVQESSPIIKQDRTNPNALNDERYQLARAALAQNQPQRAYELLRDSPPPLASATDYHAVLAAVEQQLGHYADASLRYQQLLMLDQNQASWWLGFALSLEGEHRNSDALAAYQHAAALNSLPDAARPYANARIAVLSAAVEH